MFSNEDEDEENEGIEAGVIGVTSVVMAKQRIVALLNEQQRKEDYQKRLVRKLQKLDLDLQKRREDVEELQRQLEMEKSKEAEQARSDQRERTNKARMQEERLRDQLSDVLYRKPPSTAEDKAAQEFELETVLVSFAKPNDNVRYNLSFRINKLTTVVELRNDVCKYWGVDYKDFILMTMANSKCQGDLRVRECFRHGEIAQLKLEQKRLDNELVTEAELKAIQPKASKKRKGGARRSATSFNADGAASIQKFTDNYQGQLKKMGGIFFLLKLKDNKPSEHCSKIKLRDFVLFTLFAVLTILTYTGRRAPGESYWFAKGIEDGFMINTPLPPGASTAQMYWTQVPNFKQVTTQEDMWLWLNNTLPAVLFNTDESNSVRRHNLMLGLTAIRVQNTKNFTSASPKGDYCGHDKQQDLTALLPSYALCQHLRADFQDDGSGGMQTENLETVKNYWDDVLTMNVSDVKFRGPSLPWQWRSAEENEKRGISYLDGSLSNYDASGYILDYRLDVEDYTPEVPKYKEDLTMLRDLEWISTRTRLVVVSLSIYNFDYDLFAACDFMFELSPGGTVMTDHYIRPYRPNTQETKIELQEGYLDWIRVTIAIYIFVFVGMAERRHKTKNHKAGYLYLMSLNGFTDIGIVICMATIFIWRFVEFHKDKTTHFMEGIVDIDNYHGFRGSTGTARNYNNLFTVEGVLFVLIMYRMLSLFRLNHKVYLLWHTIGSAWRAYMYMVAVFLPTIVGFVFIANSVWGKTLSGYSSMSLTFLRVYDIVEGHIDMTVLTKMDAAWACFYFLVFYAFVKFLLLNVFVTILVDAYYVVKVTASSNEHAHAWNMQKWRSWAIPALFRDVARALVMKTDMGAGGE